MPRIEKCALVPYSVGQMWNLVADVDAYPSFVPGCHAVKVHARSEREVRASIQVVKGPVRKWFTTVNRLVPNERMDLSLVDGPFRFLEGHWRFEPLGDAGSKVSLEMEFEFSNRFLEKTVGPVFSELANRMVSAFVERASSVYG